MKNTIVIATIYLICLELCAGKLLTYRVNIENFNLNAVKLYLKWLSIDELRAMIDSMKRAEARKQEELIRIQELEKKRLQEEIKKQNVIQAYIKERFGKTSVLNDFFANRI